MSAADGWDLTVPEDVAELAAELRRHGVLPGQRLHIVPAPEQSAPPAARPRRLSFVGSIQGGPVVVSAHTEEYLRGFGQE